MNNYDDYLSLKNLIDSIKNDDNILPVFKVAICIKLARCFYDKEA